MADWDLDGDPLEALREGDPAPFEAFVRSHARRLFAFFKRQGAGRHRAEDLTQEVFLKLHSHAPRYRAEERFAALCLRVARNVWIDDRRRAGVRGGGRTTELDPESGELPASTIEPEASGPLERAVVREESARLRAALLELGEPHRAVFELAVIEELGYAEIASILEIPVGTVKSRMFHAVRKLRGALEGDSAEGVA